LNFYLICLFGFIAFAAMAAFEAVMLAPAETTVALLFEPANPAREMFRIATYTVAIETAGVLFVRWSVL
jgi:hypothetical protein